MDFIQSDPIATDWTLDEDASQQFDLGKGPVVYFWGTGTGDADI